MIKYVDLSVIIGPMHRPQSALNLLGNCSDTTYLMIKDCFCELMFDTNLVSAVKSQAVLVQILL